MSAVLANRVALVTGAASGIGLAIAQRFADESARVIAVDVEGSPLESELPETDALRLVSVDVTAVGTPDDLLRAAEPWGASTFWSTTPAFVGLDRYLTSRTKVEREPLPSTSPRRFV